MAQGITAACCLVKNYRVQSINKNLWMEGNLMSPKQNRSAQSGMDVQYIASSWFDFFSKGESSAVVGQAVQYIFQTQHWIGLHMLLHVIYLSQRNWTSDARMNLTCRPRPAEMCWKMIYMINSWPCMFAWLTLRRDVQSKGEKKALSTKIYAS